MSEGDHATGARREGALNEAGAEPGQGRGRESGHEPMAMPGHERRHLSGPDSVAASGAGSGHAPDHAPRPEPARTVSPWLSSSRFALYYAPSRGSPWWDAGCRWLGRDPETGSVLAPPRVPALEARGKDVATLSRAPARYGWHGTLVAPARCAPGVTPDDVLHEALEWTQHQKTFELSVEAASLGRFVALRPVTAGGAASIAALAADALHTLACLRAVATGQETRRRLESDLTVRQRELLERWGYPYVLDEFRFHMTLSDSIDDDDDRATLLAWWHAQESKLGPLHVDSAALFVEPEPGAPFVLWARLPFGGRG